MMPTTATEAPAKGLRFDRRFSTEGQDPYESVQWKQEQAVIRDEAGKEIFRQDDVEIPHGYTEVAKNVVVSKYFYGDPNKTRPDGSPERERSVRQLVHRVARTVADWGHEGGYFASREDGERFHDELVVLLVQQYAAFNSPVWFNVGLWHRYGIEGSSRAWRWDRKQGRVVKLGIGEAYRYPQGSACFIQSVEDDMGGIMALATSEAMLFKYGSGTGTDLSTLRSCREKVNGGGSASGPVSFMGIYDAIAATVKSGGKCLAPHQPVFTAGGVKTARELAEAGEDFTVLSYSRRLGRVAAKRARAWKSGSKEVWSLRTDKGEFHLSADHPIMLATGRFVELEDLKPGMSLMASRTYAHPMGYVSVALTPTGRYRDLELLHRLVAADILGWDIAGKVVHHDGDNKDNSEPARLALLPDQAAHAALHNNRLVAEGRHVFQQRKFDHSGEANGMHSSSAFWLDEDKVAAYREKQGTILKESGRAGDMQAAARRVRMLNTGYSLINAGHDIATFEGYVTARKAVGRRCPSVPGQLKKFEREFGSYAAFYEELRNGNHEVVEVRKLGYMDVYDVEVDDPTADTGADWDEHNFAIRPLDQVGQDGTSIYVHNTRRAAKMQSLKVGHPDILEFIEAKTKEEAKAQTLVRGGYSSNFNAEAYSSVKFQNCNMSVRATDEFLALAESGGAEDLNWQTYKVTDGLPDGMPAYNASRLLDGIAEGTWICGDPGLQYEDTIQRWHTCPNTAPINASNPCCFVGETLVNTSEGMIPIGKLADMAAAGVDLPYAFAFDRTTGLPVLRRITNAWCAGKTRELIQVATDKGLVFHCTPEHRFLTHEMTYVEAKDLRPGQRLRKISRSVNGQRANRRWITHKVTPDVPNGCEILSRWMWEQVHGQIPAGMEVHHKNDDPTVDRLSNLELKQRHDHRSEHSRGLNNGNTVSCEDRLLVEIWEAIEATPRRTHKSGPAVTVMRWNTYIKTNNLIGRVPQAGSPTNGGRIRGMTWEQFAAWIAEQRSLVNDKVTTIQPYQLDREVAVYDIEVEDVHNFEITAAGFDHGIVVSNSEYMFIDDSACNLASLNLMKFRLPGGRFDVAGFRVASRVMITAQEIIVDNASYPTEEIARNSHLYRPLGLGYCNLGALIMAMGLPYDSDEGRDTAAAITAILTGQGYLTSAHHAGNLGAFEGFAANRWSMLNVMHLHRGAVESRTTRCDPELRLEAQHVWDSAIEAGERWGYRNSQISVLAPTGTISFMMGADTTGIEPDIALVKYKQLAGGGTLVLVNGTVGLALETLGYDEVARDRILAHLRERSTIEGAPGLSPEHLPVFDCSFTPVGGSRSIAFGGHLRMLGAAQPFVSGAISKTCNLPREATAADIRQAYLDGWRLGAKAVAIYRDGSKEGQPVTTALVDDAGRLAEAASAALTASAAEVTELKVRLADLEGRLEGQPAPHRRHLPDTRRSLTHKFHIEGIEGYITVGLFPDGTPGELFITMAKEGSTVGGLMDVIGTLTSMGLQYGVPLEVFVNKFAHSRFEPSGYTHNSDLPIARSLADYIFRWLGISFLPDYRAANVPRRDPEPDPRPGTAIGAPFPLAYEALGMASGNGNGRTNGAATPFPLSYATPGPRPGRATVQLTGPPCPACNMIMVPSGARCFKCENCGNPGPCG